MLGTAVSRYGKVCIIQHGAVVTQPVSMAPMTAGSTCAVSRFVSPRILGSVAVRVWSGREFKLLFSLEERKREYEIRFCTETVTVGHGGFEFR